jgi:hypothetical protein
MVKPTTNYPRWHSNDSNITYDARFTTSSYIPLIAYVYGSNHSRNYRERIKMKS